MHYMMIGIITFSYVWFLVYTYIIVDMHLNVAVWSMTCAITVCAGLAVILLTQLGERKAPV